MMRQVVIITALSCSTLMNAQSSDLFITWAEEAIALGDHFGASVYYKEALELDPGTMELQWQLAEASRLSGQCELAAEMYEHVASKDHKRTLPDARWRQAQMLTCAGKVSEAKRAWRQALKKERNQFSVVALRAKNALHGFDLMDSLRSLAPSLQVEQLIAPVNSDNADIAPRIGPDSNLYITTSRVEYDDQYVVTDTANNILTIVSLQPDRDHWKDLQKLPPVVNNGELNGNAAWTKEGHFIFSRCSPGGNCKLMISKRENGDLLPAVELEGVNKKGSNTQPAVARFNNEQTLFFTSDRRGGSGGTDIWLATLKGDEVSNMRVAGAPVNSPGNESTPYFDEAERTLYFSSDFHPGAGGHDVFTSVPLREGFSTPRNIGPSINTHKNELYPSYYPQLGFGLFSRSHSDGGSDCAGQCCADVFQFTRPAEEEIVEEDTMLTVVNEGTRTEIQGGLQSLLPIRLYFHNDEPEPRSWSTTTQQTYAGTFDQYHRLLPDYVEQQGADRGRMDGIQEFFKDEVEGNFSKLDRYLSLLEKVLQRGDTIELTIRGFASPLAKSDYNANLSLRRISSLINYLHVFNNGVLKKYLDGAAESGRLLVKQAPYGETTAASSVSDELTDIKNSVYSKEAALERRIEIEAIDLFSALDPVDTLLIVQDLGRIPSGIPQEVEFTVTNGQREPLSFTGSQAACGCTNASLPEQPLAPGGTVPLKVHFNGRAPVGPFQRDIKVTTDGVPKFITLRIQGEVIK